MKQAQKLAGVSRPPASRTTISHTSRLRRAVPWIALGLGLAILSGSAVAYKYYDDRALPRDLIAKLPADAYFAGTARFSATNPATFRQVAAATNIYSAETTALFDALPSVTDKESSLRQALADNYAFAATARGSVAIVTVRRPGLLPDLQSALGNVLQNPETSGSDDARVITGTIKSGAKLSVAQRGATIYVGSNPEIVLAATKENNGFTRTDRFTEVANLLPAAADGYLFYRTEPVKDLLGISDAPALIGATFRDTGHGKAELRVRRALSGDQLPRLPKTSGRLLPPTEQGTSIEGVAVLKYLRLLEAQRQENNLPKVLTLQNGLASLSRDMGVNVEDEYLAAATGHFVYSRVQTDTGYAWKGAVEFPDAATASAKVADLKARLTKVTVPVRKEVVTILPDGTQSREVVAEVRQPISYLDEAIGTQTGSYFALPGSIPVIHFLQSGSYLVVASSAAGLQQMSESITQKTHVGSEGELAIRLKITDAAKITQKPDALIEWILATRPSDATLQLDTTSGILEGTVNFEHAS